MERAEPYQNGLKENKRAKRDAVIRQVCVHFVILLFLFFVALPIWFLFSLFSFVSVFYGKLQIGLVVRQGLYS